jgi:hypothetical protein
VADARTSSLEDRQAYAEYWDQELRKWNQKLAGLSLSEMLARLSSEDWARFKSIQEWYPRVVDMLGFLEDKLKLRGFDEIVRVDFAALRQMLQQARSELHS